MPVKLAPPPRQQYENANGIPYVGGKLFTYAAGSSTKQTTYTDSVGGTANTNPIILDSAGRTPFGMWLTEGLKYKFVLAPSTDTDPPGSPIFTEDGIAGVNDTATTTSQWITAGATPTYISTTQFTLIGDKTADFHVGRRVKFTVTAGTVYGRISATAYTTLTTVTIVGGALDSGLSAVELSALTATNHAIPVLVGADLQAIGIQPLDTELTTLSAITAQQATDLASVSAFIGTMLNDADPAAARATIGVVASSETVSGIIELATTAEAVSGTDAVRAITPAGLRGGLNAGGTAPIYAARAWVTFAGATGAIPSGGAGNVSSVTRNGVGDYTITFATALPDANYSISGITQIDQSGNTQCGEFGIFRGVGYVLSASSARLRTNNGAQAPADVFTATFSFFR